MAVSCVHEGCFRATKSLYHAFFFFFSEWYQAKFWGQVLKYGLIGDYYRYCKKIQLQRVIGMTGRAIFGCYRCC